MLLDEVEVVRFPGRDEAADGGPTGGGASGGGASGGGTRSVNWLLVIAGAAGQCVGRAGRRLRGRGGGPGRPGDERRGCGPLHQPGGFAVPIARVTVISMTTRSGLGRGGL